MVTIFLRGLLCTRYVSVLGHGCVLMVRAEYLVSLFLELVRRQTLLMSVVWAILRDPFVYPDDPESFNPDRFLLNGQLNPNVPRPEAFYCYGRR